MNEILDIEIILNKNKYHPIYNLGIILIIIISVLIHVTSIYKYQTYLITKGKIKDHYLELMIEIDDIKYFTNQDNLIIDNKKYHYNIKSISEDSFVDELYNNYKYIYLEIDNLNNINNYVYNIKIPKENKKIIKYLKDYL